MVGGLSPGVARGYGLSGLQPEGATPDSVGRPVSVIAVVSGLSTHPIQTVSELPLSTSVKRGGAGGFIRVRNSMVLLVGFWVLRIENVRNYDPEWGQILLAPGATRGWHAVRESWSRDGVD